MNEEELEKLDRIIDEWRGGDTSSHMLREKIVELVNEITIEIISHAHPVIREYDKQQQEDE